MDGFNYNFLEGYQILELSQIYLHNYFNEMSIYVVTILPEKLF